MRCRCNPAYRRSSWAPAWWWLSSWWFHPRKPSTRSRRCRFRRSWACRIRTARNYPQSHPIRCRSIDVYTPSKVPVSLSSSGPMSWWLHRSSSGMGPAWCSSSCRGCRMACSPARTRFRGTWAASRCRSCFRSSRDRSESMRCSATNKCSIRCTSGAAEAAGVVELGTGSTMYRKLAPAAGCPRTGTMGRTRSK